MYPIVQVPASAWELPEPLGTKPKFWYDDKTLGRSLFKYVRGAAGEDWSEKVAAELAMRLGLPHATYELAECDGNRGVVSPTFVPATCRLVLGNEVLSGISADYPAGDARKFHIREHTLDFVLHALESLEGLSAPVGWLPPHLDLSGPAAVFVGYLMLDAWIGNQDRHHENWGLIDSSFGTRRLAPTFDHASCLGCTERDATRKEILTTRDRGRSISAYVRRARSAFYLSKAASKPMGTIEVFQKAMARHAKACTYWLSRLAKIDESQIKDIFDAIPSGRIGAIASQFAQTMLAQNRVRLENLDRS